MYFSFAERPIFRMVYSLYKPNSKLYGLSITALKNDKKCRKYFKPGFPKLEYASLR